MSEHRRKPARIAIWRRCLSHIVDQHKAESRLRRGGEFLAWVYGLLLFGRVWPLRLNERAARPLH